MVKPDNDNRPPRARMPIRGVPIIGFVGDDGQVTITDPTWRPVPQAAAGALLPFPNDPREA